VFEGVDGHASTPEPALPALCAMPGN